MKTRNIILLGLLFLSKLSIAQQAKKVSLLTQQSNIAIQKKEYSKALKYLSEASDLQPSDTTLALKVAEMARSNNFLPLLVFFHQQPCATSTHRKDR